MKSPNARPGRWRATAPLAAEQPVTESAPCGWLLRGAYLKDVDRFNEEDECRLAALEEAARLGSPS